MRLFVKMITNFADILLELAPEETIKTIKKLPFEMVYQFLIHLKKRHETFKFQLLEYLEMYGKSHVIKNKILYFELVCKFEPSKAREQIFNLNISDYEECLLIAQKFNCQSVVAFICFKQGQYRKAFDIYSKM